MLHDTETRTEDGPQSKVSSSRMNVKVRRLLKGLRYISHIFGEGEEHKDEIKIGFPTDVKHVAHIGCTGSRATGPSWMKEFKEANGGIESVTLLAFARTIQGISSSEESVGSSSRAEVSNSDTGGGPRRRPMRQKKTRRGKKKGAVDDGSLRSSATSPYPPSEKSKCESAYGSAHESDDEGSAESSYGSVASSINGVGETILIVGEDPTVTN